MARFYTGSCYDCSGTCLTTEPAIWGIRPGGVCQACQQIRALRAAMAKVRARRSLGSPVDLYSAPDIDYLLEAADAGLQTLETRQANQRQTNRMREDDKP